MPNWKRTLSLSSQKYPKNGKSSFAWNLSWKYIGWQCFCFFFFFFNYSFSRPHIYFSFSSTTPGMYDVQVLYRSRNISEMKFQLDDLLERQHNNELEFETDFLKLNVNLLIYLLNKLFISDKWVWRRRFYFSSFFFSNPFFDKHTKDPGLVIVVGTLKLCTIHLLCHHQVYILFPSSVWLGWID